MNNRVSLVFIISIFAISFICKDADSNPTTDIATTNIDLIDAFQLKDDISNWIILDARPIKYWENSHIPDSIPFSWEDYTTTDKNQIPYRILPPEQIAESLGKIGISAESHIVIYGDADKSWGGEGWACWVFAWLGHKGEIRLLKGGIQAWERNSYPLINGIKENLDNDEQKKSKENKNSKPVKYKLELTYSSSQSPINIYAKEINDNVDKYQLVDTRSTIEWFKGHLPNAVHIPWEKFFKGKDRSPINAEELKLLLNTNGLNMEKTVVYYCTGGIRSGYAWTVHNLAGLKLKRLPKAINFEGGVAEWEKVIKN
ncbi:MAG: hypothetical protein HQK72_12760 [Desulfamplus sp.]|nr:hypothetical protein [Desulfamplus sp.]